MILFCKNVRNICDISLWRIDLLLQWTCIVLVFEIFTPLRLYNIKLKFKGNNFSTLNYCHAHSKLLINDQINKTVKLYI